MKRVLLFWLLPLYVWADSDVVFVTEYLPPYQIVDKRNQLINGTSHAVVVELAKRANIQPSFLVMPWARAYKTALEQKDTFIYSMARSPQRENRFHWIGQLRQLKFHFYGLSENQQHVNLALREIMNQKVATIRGSIEQDLLQQVGFTEEKNLIVTDSYPSAWKMVIKGRANLVYGSEYIAKAMPSTLEVDEGAFKVLYTLNQVLDLYIAANKNTSPKLLVTMKDAYENMQYEGALESIVAKQEHLIFEHLLNERLANRQNEKGVVQQ